jgi:hypothetical protein
MIYLNKLSYVIQLHGLIYDSFYKDKDIDANFRDDLSNKQFMNHKDKAMFITNQVIDSIFDLAKINKKINLFEVKKEADGKPIGFLVVTDQLQLIYSFGIFPKARGQYSKAFMDLILKAYPNYQFALYDRNERAIQWLQKNGYLIVLTDQDHEGRGYSVLEHFQRVNDLTSVLSL